MELVKVLARAVDDPALSKEILAAARDAFGGARPAGRHQVNVVQQRAPRRLHLRWADRALFIWLYRRCPRTNSAWVSRRTSGSDSHRNLPLSLRACVIPSSLDVERRLIPAMTTSARGLALGRSCCVRR